MNKRLFYDDEDIIGYSDDIIADIKDNTSSEEEELTQELIAELKKHDGLVLCWYHPMGAWVVKDLVEA